MKKIGLLVCLFMGTMAFYSCSDSDGEVVDTEMNDMLNQEADSLEMLDEEIENTKADLEKSTQEVDDLLNNL